MPILTLIISGSMQRSSVRPTCCVKDLAVCRDLNSSPLPPPHLPQVLVLLDVSPDQSMVDEGVAREVINRIQKLRKKVGDESRALYFYWLKHAAGELKAGFSNRIDGGSCCDAKCRCEHVCLLCSMWLHHVPCDFCGVMCANGAVGRT